MPDALASYEAAVSQLGQLPDVMRGAGCSAAAIATVSDWIQQTVLPAIQAGGDPQMANGAKVAKALTYEEADMVQRYGPNWRDNPEAAAAFDRAANDLAHGLAHPEEGSFM